MIPYSEIDIGDWFSNPIHRGFGTSSGLEWLVIDKKEGLIKVQPYKYATSEPFGKPMWIKQSNRMFSEAWKI